MNGVASVSVPRANWRSNHPTPGESLWSILHKFCALNHITGHTLGRYYRRPGYRAALMRIQQPHGRIQSAQDLRFWGAYDLAKLSAAMGVEDSWESCATFEDMGLRSFIRKRTVSFLRYCPRCIELGVHATFFQLSDELRCPVHSDLLRDSCPKCGKRIPYCPPSGKIRPYSCVCGRLLWWGLRDETWKSPFSNSDKTILSSHQNGLFGSLGNKGYGYSDLCKFHPKDENDDFLNGIFGLSFDMEPPVLTMVTTTIRRQWESGFKTRFRSATRHSRGVYSVILPSDSDFQDEVIRIFRRIERIVVKRIPRSKLKRGFMVSRSVKTLRQIALSGCSPEFMAYVLWKAHWVDAPAHRHPLRRNLSAEDIMEEAALVRSKVYWRFTQYARLLSPMGAFTSADAWAQLHYFALVVFATHESAESLVKDITGRICSCNDYKSEAIRPWFLPFVSLINVAASKPIFDLKISTKMPQFYA